MRGFYIEKRTVPQGTTLSADLAQHIYLRGTSGCAVVVTDKPHDLGSITKKQWHVLIRKVERERASTLKAGKIAELNNQIRWMERLEFTIKPEGELPESGVVFAAPEELINFPPICSTLYITCTLSNNDLRFLTSWVRERCVVIAYEQKKA